MTFLIAPVDIYAGLHPDKPAVIDDRPGGSVTIWSYAELDRQAGRLANVLRDLGVGPGDKFVWCGRNSPGIVRAIHARQKVGATSVPLNYRLAPDEVAYVTYYKAAEKYEAGRREDFCTVGDIAYRDVEGYYYICDRKNDMVISGGMNIYPAELEAAIDQHPGVLEVAAFGIPSEQWGETIHAVVVRRPGHVVDADEIIAFARGRLAGYKVPRSVSFAEELPHTGSGKILKRELREPYWRGHRTRVG